MICDAVGCVKMSDIYEATTKVLLQQYLYWSEEILGMGEVNTRAVGYIYEDGESLFSESVKLRKATIISVMSVPASVHPSVCPHGTTRLPLHRYL